MEDGSFSHQSVPPVCRPTGSADEIRNPDYHPPSRPYEMINLTLDLIHLARYLLVPKGRLVFFLPTITEDWDDIDLPPVEGMRELKIDGGSVQDFHGWGRRVCDTTPSRRKSQLIPCSSLRWRRLPRILGHVRLLRTTGTSMTC